MSFCKAKFDEMPDLNVHIASVHEGKKHSKRISIDPTSSHLKCQRGTNDIKAVNYLYNTFDKSVASGLFS